MPHKKKGKQTCLPAWLHSPISAWCSHQNNILFNAHLHHSPYQGTKGWLYSRAFFLYAVQGEWIRCISTSMPFVFIEQLENNTLQINYYRANRASHSHSYIRPLWVGIWCSPLPNSTTDLLVNHRHHLNQGVVAWCNSPLGPYFFLFSSTWLWLNPLSSSTPKYRVHSSQLCGGHNVHEDDCVEISRSKKDWDGKLMFGAANVQSLESIIGYKKVWIYANLLVAVLHGEKRPSPLWLGR